MQIDFLGMHAFLSVVEQGGFVQAATHLNLSQAAVSHRIRKLEEVWVSDSSRGPRAR
jgi:DNA-binding transcriptional LysR family regulator